MAAGSSDDELARTATAPGTSDGADAPVAPSLGGSLGRFRLERELGAGGMGVVHAAFDPDLERRVALKVLRTLDGGGEARERLLREAKAMARLDHPNVVTVHEVDSAGGRDYVVMELIDGHTLAEWLRSGRRSRREILAAFVEAGRGLAGAHAADLVHRDFKPHNVLRRHDGRIVVTDFGLARGVDRDSAVDTTLPLRGGSATASHTPSSLSGLTQTGSVLGTPAYMAPEQWGGGAIGPAADQFAFCVALWEALTGERPFRGTTIEELQREVRQGPAELDASKLPRALRSAIRRGLDPDPAKRWPSMDALLAVIERAERPRRRAIVTTVVFLGVAVFGIVRYALPGERAAAVVTCPPPAHEASAVWPLMAPVELANHGRLDVASVLGNDVATWRTLRADLCKTAPDQHVPELACLDGVLGRLDVVHRAALAVTGELTGDVVAAELVDPEVCTRAQPPRLAIMPNADLVAAFTAMLEAERSGTPVPAELVQRSVIEPCTHAVVMLAQVSVLKDLARQRDAALEAVTEADRCGDERLRADAALVAAPLQFEPIIGPKGDAAMRTAEAQVARVAQPDLVATLALLRAQIAHQRARDDESLQLADKAIDGFGKRGRTLSQLAAAAAKIEYRFSRGQPDDLERIRDEVKRWRPIAEAEHDDDLIGAFDRSEGVARFVQGDVAGARAILDRAWRRTRASTKAKKSDKPTRAVAGEVVDSAGHPVAGATVVVARGIVADTLGVPFFLGDVSDDRFVVTDASGRFAVPDAPEISTAIAQLGAERSQAVRGDDAVRLVLGPTRSIKGTVELGGLLSTKVMVIVQGVDVDVHGPSYQLVAPVSPDGTFTIDGAPVERIEIAAIVGFTGNAAGPSLSFVRFDASPRALDGVRLHVSTTGRRLAVIVRSTLSQPLDAAQILVLTGKIQATSLGQLMKVVGTQGMQQQFARTIVGEQAPRAAVDQLHPGDLVADFDNVRDGELSVCAIPIPGDINDPTVARQIEKHREELELRCVPVAADAQVVTVETPPQKRLD
jgi:hypothetical protein